MMEDELCRTQSTYKREKKCILHFSWSKVKRICGRTTWTWEDNIKMELKNRIWEYDWIQVAQNRTRFVTEVLQLWVLYKTGNFLTSFLATRFSCSTLLHGVSVIIKYWQQEITSWYYLYQCFLTFWIPDYPSSPSWFCKPFHFSVHSACITHV